MADHWLVRTKENLIAGPYTGDQIKELVLSGKLGYQDEVCKANGYWIYLHERQEVKNLLGIDVPKPSKDPDEEVTETETQTETILEMESSLDAAGGEDVTRVGTLIARKRPASAGAPEPPVAESPAQAAPAAPRPAAAPRPHPAPHTAARGEMSHGIINGANGKPLAANEPQSSRQRLLLLLGAAAIAAFLIFRYFNP